MKTFIYTLFFILLTNITLGQSGSNCEWTFENGMTFEAINTFEITKSKTLAVYGNHKKEKNKLTYSDFVLYQCGDSTVISEWDGTQTCTIKQDKDTLIIQELYPIPNGQNFSVNWLEFYVTKYYLKGNKIENTTYFRNDLKKYSSLEIKQLLKQFESQKEPILNYDNYLIAINRLFWAYVSGSKRAETYLEKLRNKYRTFDGAISEDFDNLIMTFENYKTFGNSNIQHFNN